ncbi:helix-turn-helix domain-containing protein [Vibrio europaeus]|uniref:helix-turn-helix domain-containing protein n=1 Tax=Vibrio europaeus TaxID=300876 RepID=UPI00233F1095|nr:helix-turn-helix transcriptional regulator [Vibrio europaeus]MDC5755207.1 helix-turn-helix domain-containing protein [Vibrio europaeus]MDC5775786.1 helix-turn-helix domain-containing protein [Vibrio europaeus]MDC5794924.1 helix-turn-helix domain-containing protein [Vibrio europaeus]MDC5799495.1 helix-turn-helix domain-containing protein [Vibrio europaeus]MDC5817203.1 helix-turn-helix domain-containing protein [Vibrio europaeus]
MSSVSSDAVIGERLLSFRNSKNLSQSAIAKSLGVSLRTYQNYERGERSITKEFICAFCECFEESADWLLTGAKSGGVDWDVLETIISTLEELLERERLIIDPDKKVKLISLFYRLNNEQKDVSETTIRDMLMLSVGS